MNDVLLLIGALCTLCAFVAICAVIAGARADRFNQSLDHFADRNGVSTPFHSTASSSERQRNDEC